MKLRYRPLPEILESYKDLDCGTLFPKTAAQLAMEEYLEQNPDAVGLVIGLDDGPHEKGIPEYAMKISTEILQYGGKMITNMFGVLPNKKIAVKFIMSE